MPEVELVSLLTKQALNIEPFVGLLDFQEEYKGFGRKTLRRGEQENVFDLLSK